MPVEQISKIFHAELSMIADGYADFCINRNGNRAEIVAKFSVTVAFLL